MGKSKTRHLQPVFFSKNSRFQRRQRHRFISPLAQPEFVALQPLGFFTCQAMARFAERIERHRGVTAAAGLPMRAQPHQRKTAALPETPQLRRVAKTHREIIPVRSLRRRPGHQPLTQPFALASRMHGNTADAQPGQRSRQWATAVRRQRLRHQIAARSAIAGPHRLAKRRLKTALLHQP